MLIESKILDTEVWAMLSKSAKFAYCLLAMRANGGKAFPSIDQIAKDGSMKPHTVISAIKELIDNKLVIRKKRFGSSSIYELPVLPETAVMTETAVMPKEAMQYCPKRHDSIDPNGNVIDKVINKVIDKSTRTPFQKPSLEDVIAECQKRKSNVDPERFWHFYESKGWLVGKSKMKSWKSALVTWEKGDAKAAPQQAAPAAPYHRPLIGRTQ